MQVVNGEGRNLGKVGWVDLPWEGPCGYTGPTWAVASRLHFMGSLFYKEKKTNLSLISCVSNKETAIIQR